MRVVDRLKRGVAPVLVRSGCLGLHRRVRAWTGRPAGATVLVFHRVGAAGPPGSALDTPLEAFREIVAFLRRECRVVPLDAAVSLPRAALPARAVAITFDDGYRETLRVAAPVLAQAGLPWAVFLPVAYVGTRRLLWWDLLACAARRLGAPAVLDLAGRVLAGAPGAGPAPGPAGVGGLVAALKRAPDRARRRVVRALERRLALDARGRRAGGAPGDDAELAPYRMLDWAEVRRLATAGVTLGAHSLTHPVLPTASEAVRRREIAGARRWLERGAGVPVRYFAYPDGAADARARRLVAAAGYRAAFLADAAARADDPLRLPRKGLYTFSRAGGGFSAAVLAAELAGVFDGPARLVGWR